MTIFSDTFKRLIQEKNINIYLISKRFGIDRTTLYKMASGSRIPTIDFLNEVVNALCLSPSETLELMENYQIVKYGETNYKRRKKVKKILERLSCTSDYQTDIPDIPNIPKISLHNNSLASGSYSVNSLCKKIILEEIFTAENPSFSMIIQPDYDFLFDILLPEICMWKNNTCVQIDHIFCVKNIGENRTECFINLDYFSKIVPLSISSTIDYIPYYYYDHVGSHPNLMFTFPYYLVTSKVLLLLSHDYQNACIISNTEIINHYRNDFNRIKEQSRRLVYKCVASEIMLEHYIKIETNSQGSLYWCEAEPRMAKFYTDEILERILRTDLPNRAIQLELAKKRFNLFKLKTPNYYSYFTLNRLFNFVQTGSITHLPDNYWNPFSYEDRKYLLLNFYAAIKRGEIFAYMMDSTKINIPLNTSIAVLDQSGVNFATFSTGSHVYTIINIDETTFTNSFLDFFSNLSSTKYVHSKEETLLAIKSVLTKM